MAPKEIPTFQARLIDIGSAPPAPSRESGLLDALMDEISSSPPEPVVAYRGPERLSQRFTQVAIGLSEPGTGLREGGTYLITGGLGGIGLVVARELAEKSRVNLVLMGRKGLPEGEGRRMWLEQHGKDDKTSRAIREVEDLERLGAKVLVVEADVTDGARMRQVVQLAVERFGALNGVFHTAGVLDDGPLLARSIEQARSVLDAKVRGTIALDAALERIGLDFLVLFSSVSAVIGAPGQVDYAAANAFLDAFARSRCDRSGQRTVAIGWGAWKGVGMAAELAGEARYGAESGMGEGTLAEIRNAFFDVAVSGREGERAFRTRFAVGRHWMMDEHQIRGGPWVLPGSGYVELIRAATYEVTAGEAFDLRDLVFLRPFRIHREAARDLEVRLTPNRDGWAVVVRGRSAEPEAEWVEHATARVRTSPPELDTFEALEDIVSRVGVPRAKERPAHPVMNFGPRWGNIEAEATSGAESLLRHSLPEAFLGDLASTVLHPAILDMATAGAQHLIPGVDTAKGLLVPAGYGALLMSRPLGGKATSHVVLRSSDDAGALVSFDVTIYDAEGRVAVAVRDFSMIRIEGEALEHQDTESGPDWLRDAISPAEGREVLRRVLGHRTGPNVLVATRPLEVLIAESTRAPVRARRADAPRKAASRAILPAVAETLEAHDAVAEAVALGSPDAEAPRVVAFIAYKPGKHATVSELRRFVRGSLEKGLVPQNFVEMMSLPRSADGAVAVAELRDPFAAVDDFVGPRTPTEEIIAGIWAELLALDRVGIHDNFLDVGGHSLVGIRVLRRIEQATGVRIEANALTMQTLEQLAAGVDREAGTRRNSNGRGPEGGAGLRRTDSPAMAGGLPLQR